MYKKLKKYLFNQFKEAILTISTSILLLIIIIGYGLLFSELCNVEETILQSSKSCELANNIMDNIHGIIIFFSAISSISTAYDLYKLFKDLFDNKRKPKYNNLF